MKSECHVARFQQGMVGWSKGTPEEENGRPRAQAMNCYAIPTFPEQSRK